MSQDIFLSYRRTDREFAAQLVRELEKRGLTVWYDADIEGGQDWREEIVTALQASKMLVILFSESCNESRQLKKELAVADSFEKPVVPILIENCRPKGAYLYELADRNWIEAWPEPHSRINELVGLLTALAGKAPAPAAQPSPTLTGGLASPAPQAEATIVANDEAPVREEGGKAAAIASLASAYIGKKDKRLAKAAKRSDILPFLWIDLAALVPILGALNLWILNGDHTSPDVTSRILQAALVCTLTLGLYGAIAFPVRYFMRSRPVDAAIRSYLISSAVFLAIALALGIALNASDLKAMQLVATLLGCMWAGFAIIAFTIYGVLAGQRALARFNANLRQI